MMNGLLALYETSGVSEHSIIIMHRRTSRGEMFIVVRLKKRSWRTIFREKLDLLFAKIKRDLKNQRFKTTKREEFGISVVFAAFERGKDGAKAI